jgi:hypothetical protein
LGVPVQCLDKIFFHPQHVFIDSSEPPQLLALHFLNNCCLYYSTHSHNLRAHMFFPKIRDPQKRDEQNKPLRTPHWKSRSSSNILANNTSFSSCHPPPSLALVQKFHPVVITSHSFVTRTGLYFLPYNPMMLLLLSGCKNPVNSEYNQPTNKNRKTLKHDRDCVRFVQCNSTRKTDLRNVVLYRTFIYVQQDGFETHNIFLLTTICEQIFC